MKTWLITGATSGLGGEMAKAAMKRGDRVVVTGRRLEAAQAIVDIAPKRALAVRIDVTDRDSVESGVAEALEWSPNIDVLVNNAGHGFHGAVEEVTDAEAREVFDVNFFGHLDMLRTILPHMRSRRSGHIINIGSISGLASGAGTGLYSATKFALEAVSEAMNAELSPLGIRVTILEPGPFRTEFNGRSLHSAASSIDDYAKTAGERSAALREGSGSQPGDPRKAAEIVCDIADAETPPLHLVLGGIAIDRAREKLDQLSREIAEWEDRSRATAL